MWDQDVGDDQLLAMVFNSPLNDPHSPPPAIQRFQPLEDYKAEVKQRLDTMEARLLRLEAMAQQQAQEQAETPRNPAATLGLRATRAPTWNNYTPADLEEDMSTPLTKVLQECDEENLPLEKVMTMSTCRMADILFSPGTLRSSTLQGRNSSEPLDPTRLGIMMH